MQGLGIIPWLLSSIAESTLVVKLCRIGFPANITKIGKVSPSEAAKAQVILNDNLFSLPKSFRQMYHIVDEVTAAYNRCTQFVYCSELRKD